jgi:hypothetical protein
MRYPGFVGTSNKGASYFADGEELINLFPQKVESSDPNAPPYCYLNTPGFEEINHVAEGPIRGSCIAGTLTFFVSGFAFYEYDSATDTATLRGTVLADANPATLCWNGTAGDQLFITSGDVGYCYELTAHTLSTVLMSGATMGAYLDGYFLALDAATGTLQISDLLDGQTWDPAQIAQRSDAADPWICMTVIHAEIWMMGNRTGAVWFNAGSFPFPFEMIQGSRFEQGIVAPFSAIRDVSPLMWLSANAQGARMVLMAQGYAGVPVNSAALVHALQLYTTVSDATSMSFQIEGQTWYVLTFPTEDVTWAWNGIGWFKLAYWNHATSTWEAWRVRTHVFTFDGVHFMGDRATGAFYRMAMDLYTDVDDAIILRERIPPRFSTPDQVRFTVPSIQVLADVGVGTMPTSDDLPDTDPDSNPQMMLQTSRDAGKTWGQERWAPLGPIGAYGTRVYWTQCGQARNRVDRFRVSAAVPIRLVDCLIDVRVGTS